MPPATPTASPRRTTTRARTTGATATPARARSSASPPPATSRNKGARNLVIVESPAKARTVENILGSDYRVIASVGHVRDLPNYGYGVEDFETFRPKYVVVKDKKRGVDKNAVIAEIAAAAKAAERVYLSTDPDREGEAISWHIQQAAGIPEEKASRVVFHEITRPAIDEAFQHPGKLNMRLVDAQQTRRVVDRLVGFPLTWFVQGKVSRTASAGRVQSVALRLVVEREREIQAFRPQEYWTIHALLAKSGARFTADLVRLPGQRAKPAIGDSAAAEALLARFRRSTFATGEVKRGERRKAPGPPFTTSTLQQAANNRLGFGAGKTMSVAQQLYEGIALPGQGPVGLITYMRTDSLNVSPIARQEARSYVAGRWGKEYVPEKERVYRTRTRGAQEAHEAVRPTSVARTPESLRGALDRDQLNLYRLVWERFVASQMADARFSTVSAEIEATDGGAAAGTFRASAQHLVFPGHLATYGVDANDRTDDDDDSESTLPELARGDALDRVSVDGRQHFTEPPPRYTEATLVRALEEKGIGRPSTYATIVQTVQKREYVKKEGRALVPQELGFLVNDMLVTYLDQYVAVPFTSKLEEQLDDIAEGARDYTSVVKEFWEEFSKKVEAAKAAAPKQQEETDVVCAVCGLAKMVVKWGRNGKFLACPRYPDCKNAMPLTQEGEPLPVNEPVQIDYQCPKCAGALLQKNGPFGPYVDCVNRDAKKCDFRAGVPVGVECPEEPGSGQLVEKRTRRGIFYGCWNYPRCSYTSNTLEPGKMPPVRDAEARAAANAKLLERSSRGKAAFAARRARPAQKAG